MPTLVKMIETTEEQFQYIFEVTLTPSLPSPSEEQGLEWRVVVRSHTLLAFSQAQREELNIQVGEQVLHAYLEWIKEQIKKLKK